MTTSHNLKLIGITSQHHNTNPTAPCHRAVAAFVDASFNKNQCARDAFYCSYRRSSDNCKAAGRAELHLARAVAVELHQLRNMDFSTHGVCGEEGEGYEGSGTDGQEQAQR